MKIIRDWKKAHLKRSSIAIGVFDGAHIGHQAILKNALLQAERLRLGSVVLTMDPHPSEVLRPERRDPLICSLSHRLKIFERLGFLATVVLRFDRSLASMPAEDFVREILHSRLDARHIAVGKNFRFGRKATGDADFLRRIGNAQGFMVRSIAPVRVGGDVVSSSRIRLAVAAGKFDLAGRLLGRPYALSGKVVRGDGRGAKIGFPTLNLRLEHELLPPPGVYAVQALSRGRRYAGVMHLGPRPTFASTDVRTEIHLLDVPGGSFYGQNFEITPLKRLRPVRRFANPAALALQIRRDISRARVFTRPLKAGILLPSQKGS